MTTLTQNPTLTRPTIDEAARFMVARGINETVAHHVAATIHDDPTQGILFSGKQGSGKDTVADALNRVVTQETAQQPVNISFAAPLKEELSWVIRELQQQPDALTREEATLTLAAAMEGNNDVPPVPFHNLEHIVGLILDDVRGGVITSGWDRGTNIRSAAQYWGTETRRAQDENYWTSKALQSITAHITQGEHRPYFTDGRYPNEADLIRNIGGVLIRLDVTPETQAQRIQNRDGITPSAQSLAHPSETALDNYPHFTTRIDTDHYTPDEIVHSVLEILTTLKP